MKLIQICLLFRKLQDAKTKKSLDFIYLQLEAFIKATHDKKLISNFQRKKLLAKAKRIYRNQLILGE